MKDSGGVPTRVCDCEVCGVTKQPKRMFVTRRRGLPSLDAGTDMNHFMEELMCGQEGYILTCQWCKQVWTIHNRRGISLEDADYALKAINWSTRLCVPDQKAFLMAKPLDFVELKTLQQRREAYILFLKYTELMEE